MKNKLVIGSDTVINYKGRMIEKVGSLRAAEKKIKKLAGKKHVIISSAAAYFNNKQVWLDSKKTTVKIRRLNDLQIKKYIKQCGPKILNSAGCYQIESCGPHIIENIKGDFFNVMGFPLFPFLKFLKELNIKK